MKKNLIAMSVVTALATTSFASDMNKEMYSQIQALKAQIEALEKEGFNIYFREIKFGLADDEYMYEVHAL